jgi:hypothetical protein
MRHNALAAACGLALSTGCGDPLIEQGFRGEPMLTFEGQIGTSLGGSTSGDGLRAALFWSPAGDTELSGELVEQPALSVAVAFPGTFEINVFEPPPAVAWRAPRSPWRVALVLLSQDADGNGRFSLDELRGGARNQAVLWAERALAAAESPTGSALAAGYHAVRLPMPCGIVPAPTDGADCGVPLGAACEADADCGAAGVCLTRDLQTFWPGGYCVQPAVSGGCTPDTGILRRTSVGEIEASYWHRGCESPAECRVDAGYRCVEDACFPGEPALLVLDPRMKPGPLCAAFETDHDEDDLGGRPSP